MLQQAAVAGASQFINLPLSLLDSVSVSNARARLISSEDHDDNGRCTIYNLEVRSFASMNRTVNRLANSVFAHQCINISPKDHSQTEKLEDDIIVFSLNFLVLTER